MKYEITKDFKFAAGHRVPTQSVNEHLALTNVNKCRHLHGHEYKVAVTIGSDILNVGVVTDFNHLNKLKEYIDKTFDHRFILWVDDPLYDIMIGHMLPNTQDEIRLKLRTVQDVYIVKAQLEGAIQELIESFVIVDFIPTAESIAEHISNYIQKNIVPKIEKGCKLLKVEVYETSTSSAVFIPVNE